MFVFSFCFVFVFVVFSFVIRHYFPQGLRKLTHCQFWTQPGSGRSCFSAAAQWLVDRFLMFSAWSAAKVISGRKPEASDLSPRARVQFYIHLLAREDRGTVRRRSVNLFEMLQSDSRAETTREVFFDEGLMQQISPFVSQHGTCGHLREHLGIDTKVLRSAFCVNCS